MSRLKDFLDSKIIKNDVGEPTYLTWKETISYALGRGAQGMGTSMMSSSYVNYFLTNLLSIPMGVAGNIRLWCGLWDAINDPILGVIVDKTRTKHGKMRPYIKYAPYVCALFTILFFLNQSNFSDGLKIAFAVITFVGWDMSYTAVDIPIGALAFSITPNGIERTKLFGFSSIVRAIVGALPAGFVAIAVAIPYFKENTAPAYAIAAAISATGMILLTRPTFYFTKERATYSDDSPSIKDCFRLLFQNRPLFMLFLSNLMFLLVTVTSAVSMYFAVDLMGDSKYVLILSIAAAPAPFIAGIGVPKLVEKLGAKTDFKKIYMTCCIIAASIHLLFFIVCRNGLLNKESTEAVSVFMAVVIILFCTLMHIPLEFKNLCGKEMEAETVDYVEWKTGERAEGVMLSLMSFTGKLTNSASSAIALFILSLTNYVTHEDMVAVPQTAEAKFALFSLFTLVPLFGYLLMLIPLKFYNITGESHRQMKDEIKQRKSLAAEGIVE